MTVTPTDGKARILVIDDDVAVRRVMCRLFDHEGYEVAEAANGREGLDYLRRGGWNIILLDQEMPEMGGDEVLRTIYKERLPGSVIVFSTFAGEDQEKKYRKLGAAALVSKGVDLNILLDIVKKELARTGRAS